MILNNFYNYFILALGNFNLFTYTKPGFTEVVIFNFNVTQKSTFFEGGEVLLDMPGNY